MESHHLDGNFGVTSDEFLSAVDTGHPYFDAESIMAAATMNDGGVVATTFSIFLPVHEFSLKGRSLQKFV